MDSDENRNAKDMLFKDKYYYQNVPTHDYEPENKNGNNIINSLNQFNADNLFQDSIVSPMIMSKFLEDELKINGRHCETCSCSIKENATKKIPNNDVQTDAAANVGSYNIAENISESKNGKSINVDKNSDMFNRKDHSFKHHRLCDRVKPTKNGCNSESTQGKSNKNIVMEKTSNKLKDTRDSKVFENFNKNLLEQIKKVCNVIILNIILSI